MTPVLKKVGNLRLYVRPDKRAILDLFGSDISRKLKEFRDVERREVLFLSSGGSALEVLDHIDEAVIGPYLTIGIFDERYDPHRHSLNYDALRKTRFFTRAVQKGCRLLDTLTQKGGTKEALAECYENELRAWKTRHPRGAVMATIGIAADGHTAGILPFPGEAKRFSSLFESERWVVAYDVPGHDPFPERITPTLTFFRSVDLVGVFLVGKEKGSMFRSLLQEGSCVDLPGRVILSLPRGAVYTDEHLLNEAGVLRATHP